MNLELRRSWKFKNKEVGCVGVLLFSERENHLLMEAVQGNSILSHIDLKRNYHVVKPNAINHPRHHYFSGLFFQPSPSHGSCLWQALPQNLRAQESDRVNKPIYQPEIIHEIL